MIGAVESLLLVKESRLHRDDLKRICHDVQSMSGIPLWADRIEVGYYDLAYHRNPISRFTELDAHVLFEETHGKRIARLGLPIEVFSDESEIETTAHEIAHVSAKTVLDLYPDQHVALVVHEAFADIAAEEVRRRFAGVGAIPGVRYDLLLAHAGRVLETEDIQSFFEQSSNEYLLRDPENIGHILGAKLHSVVSPIITANGPGYALQLIVQHPPTRGELFDLRYYRARIAGLLDRDFSPPPIVPKEVEIGI